MIIFFRELSGKHNLQDNDTSYFFVSPLEGVRAAVVVGGLNVQITITVEIRYIILRRAASRRKVYT